MSLLLYTSFWTGWICLFQDQPCPNHKTLQLIETTGMVRKALIEEPWSEWTNTPFSVLLIEDQFEFAINQNAVDSTFEQSCAGSFFRPSTFNKQLLATFPAINGKPTIVVGTPKNTMKSELAWTVTLLHEHFHQVQFNHPNYYSAQESLNLSKGDNTGMWMLNHPFPYDDDEVVVLLKRMNANLRKLLDGPLDSKLILDEHIEIKKELKRLVGLEHYSYFNLQLWQEGFARFMESEIISYWIDHFDEINQRQFTKQELLDYQIGQINRILDDLENGKIRDRRRELFYSMGAAEASLIKKTNKNWQSEYFEELFLTDRLLTNEISVDE